MKKTINAALASALLLSAVPLSASAATPPKLTIDNKPVAFSDSAPFASGNDVMVPLRRAVEALGLKVEYAPASKDVAIYATEAAKTTVKPGGSEALTPEGAVDFGAKSVVRSNRVYVPLSFFEHVLGLNTAYREDTGEAAIFTSARNEEAVRAIVELLADGQYQTLSDTYFDETMKKAVPADSLELAWEQLGAAAGEYAGIQSVQAGPGAGDRREFAAVLAFSKANAALTIILDANNRISGLWLKPVQQPAAVPESLTEEEIIVGEGTAYPLPGTLTLPKNASGPLPAVVLVHGSGPNDRDETVGPAKPFRDLAWGLAQQGIAVLRYDKRTYVHGNSFTPDMLAKFTVKEETVDDAVAAAKLLKNDKRVDASKVYVVGHSLGGMLAPRIDADGGDFAGLAILAGSPRTLWEIIADQNAAVIAAMDKDDPAKKESETLVAAELEKAKSIGRLTDEEAQSQTVFGVPAYYFKEMDARGAAELSAKLTKPVLVLQGASDVQVYADKDYAMWQEVLEHNANADFKLYPELNHFFTRDSDSGDNRVDPQVAQDLADWILAR